MAESKAWNPPWNPPWEKAPDGAVGASYNADGIAWWWFVKPAASNGKWRGPEYGKGFAKIGRVPEWVEPRRWMDSYIERPKEKSNV